MFIIDNEVVIVSVVNENIQVNFIDDNIPINVGVIDVDVVSIVDDKVLVTAISYINIAQICNVTISYW